MDPVVPADAYDSVPYRGHAFRQTHPSSVSAIGRIFSVPTVDPRHCRCLELGCGDGGNIIPMAASLPDSSFIGVDYSKVQIDLGKELSSRAALKNIELRAASILDIMPEWGRFDYIICHGVFSWVPKRVQAKILEICQQNLSHEGIAYISYNTMPGWHLRGMVREMMRYHALRFPQADQQIHEARMLLGFLTERASGAYAEPYRQILAAETALLRDVPDHYIFHEHLADCCEPFYFHDFMKWAQQYDLRYLAESRLSETATSNLGPGGHSHLAPLVTNRIELEQFNDFTQCRTFRETLLYRGASEPLSRIKPRQLAGLYFSSNVRAKAHPVNLRPDEPVLFESFTKQQVTVSEPILKAALICLINAFPGSIQFEALADRAHCLLAEHKLEDPDFTRESSALGAGLLSLLTFPNFVQVDSLPLTIVTNTGLTPVALPLARLQAEIGAAISNGRHDSAMLAETEVAVLKLLDGNNNREEVARLLTVPRWAVDDAVVKLTRGALITA